MYSLYDILMTNIDSTQSELRERYFRLTRMYNPNAKSGCYEKYLDVVRAYNILKDIYMRNFYNNFGDKGLVSLKDSRRAYFLTRTFDCVNIRLVTLILIMGIMNLAFIPMALYLHKWFALSFSIASTPLIMALCLLIVFVIRSLIYCRRYRVEKLKNEMVYMFVLGINILLTLLQIIVMCYVIDFNKSSYRYLWMIPYTLLETIICVQGIVNNPATTNNYLIEEFPRIARIAIMHIFIVKLPMQYKIFIPLVIGFIELFSRGLSYTIISCACGCIFAILYCVYSCMESPYPWLAYFIGTNFILVGVVLVSIVMVTKMRYAPVCRFGEQIALEYNV